MVNLLKLIVVNGTGFSNHFKRRLDYKKHTLLNNKELIQDFGGQFVPVKIGHGHWLFHCIH